MRRYVVSYISFTDNIMQMQEVTGASRSARSVHRALVNAFIFMKLPDIANYVNNDMEEMTIEEIGQAFFDMDCMVGILEIK